MQLTSFRITRETYSDDQGVKTAEEEMLPVFLFVVGAIFFDTPMKDSPARAGALILTVECRNDICRKTKRAERIPVRLWCAFIIPYILISIKPLMAVTGFHPVCSV